MSGLPRFVWGGGDAPVTPPPYGPVFKFFCGMFKCVNRQES